MTDLVKSESWKVDWKCEDTITERLEEFRDPWRLAVIQVESEQTLVDNGQRHLAAGVRTIHNICGGTPPSDVSANDLLNGRHEQR